MLPPPPNLAPPSLPQVGHDWSTAHTLTPIRAPAETSLRKKRTRGCVLPWAGQAPGAFAGQGWVDSAGGGAGRPQRDKHAQGEAEPASSVPEADIHGGRGQPHKRPPPKPPSTGGRGHPPTSQKPQAAFAPKAWILCRPCPRAGARRNCGDPLAQRRHTFYKNSTVNISGHLGNGHWNS